MRIIGGQHRGTALSSVGAGDPSAALRPTSDRVRESIFNVLQGGRFGDPVTDAQVLDLFAGTGALGLEAISRGAKHATFVDQGRVAIKLIRSNIAKLRREADCTILTGDTTKLPDAKAPATLVFLDPPYGKSLGHQALKTARAGGWVGPGAIVVWEESRPQVAPTGFTALDQRRYGETWVTFLEAVT